MKTFLSLVLMLAVVSFTANSQDDIKKKVTASVERLRVAMLDANEKELYALTMPELSYGHSSGLVEDQKTFISRLVKGEADFTAIDISDVTVTVSGNTAIVRHKLKGEVIDSGKSSQPNLSVLLVWQKDGGIWKLLARQAVKNP